MGNFAKTYYPQSGSLVVLGAGESGVGAAVLAKDQGFQVWVSDKGKVSSHYQYILEQEGIPYEEEQHTLTKVLAADLIIKSPGIPNYVEVLQQARSAGIPVISEIEFAAQYTDAVLIAITGSNGKTTTSMLTHYILTNAGSHVGLAGNVGYSFAYQVARNPSDTYVLELSSFMLEDMHHFRAHIAVLLNITPDHLDRYNGSLEEYNAAKFRILQNLTSDDYFIYCVDDKEILKGLEKHHTPAQQLKFSVFQEVLMGAYLNKEENKLVMNTPNNNEEFEMKLEDLSLQGTHNVYNNMAAGLVAKVQELRNKTMRDSMSSYVNVEHRLEHVACIGGVNYINDSKATNVNSVWYALESFSPNIVLIIGGVDKGNDYSMLRDLVKQKVSAIVCIGKDNGRIHDAFEDVVDAIVNSSSMSDAVEIASHLAHKGDTVLLSPACASFDRFKNYEDRGTQFKEAVMNL
ncbi:MAG TPA: UDP-N-acetylmuramoyl-L-alanine--D-glutamate ligase [Candidatus Sphingobacterium stercoripullorum]|uniref:UDP-N-acetylmuramoylalanine--D-glutamate ligase n=1 Tax=Candidatus Sphingobacterium stercoripullorum TaxID=2838759 RepID=A0A9D2B084_9SPHI|nr:UDP-N-acetylmuramoyl-L-alanine--D-glutamate ligase [Candidatus Sphingobacterium stercoripullorum]